MTQYRTIFFSPDPGPGGGNTSESSREEQETRDEDISSTEEVDEEKTVGEKVREALQDWSNKDQQDQDFDDTQV